MSTGYQTDSCMVLHASAAIVNYSRCNENGKFLMKYFKKTQNGDILSCAHKKNERIQHQGETMIVRKNLTLGGLIMLIVLVCIGVTGYLWYAHAKSERIKAEKLANIAACEKKIAIYQDEIKRISGEKTLVSQKAAPLDSAIKATSDKLDADNAFLKKSNEELSGYQKKLFETRRTVNEYNQKLRNNRHRPVARASTI